MSEQDSIAAVPPESRNWKTHKRMMKSEFGRKEVLHPVAAQDFGQQHYMLASCGA